MLDSYQISELYQKLSAIFHGPHIVLPQPIEWATSAILQAQEARQGQDLFCFVFCSSLLTEFLGPKNTLFSPASSISRQLQVMYDIVMCRYVEPASPLSLYREPSFGHGRLRIVNETHAYWSWQRNNDLDAFVADEVWLQSLSTSKACWDKQAAPSSFPNDEL